MRRALPREDRDAGSFVQEGVVRVVPPDGAWATGADLPESGDLARFLRPGDTCSCTRSPDAGPPPPAVLAHVTALHGYRAHLAESVPGGRLIAHRAYDVFSKRLSPMPSRRAATSFNVAAVASSRKAMSRGGLEAAPAAHKAGMWGGCGHLPIIRLRRGDGPEHSGWQHCAWTRQSC
jgi:hypothetical protein